MSRTRSAHALSFSDSAMATRARSGAERQRHFGVVGGATKRAVDLPLAVVALMILSPLILMVALAVWVTSPGPVLFGHKRIGLGGRPFRCWKFRTMVTNGDEMLEQHFEENPEARREWQDARKLKNDPRVTRLGAALRAYSLDELPQLINVLRGDMSLVGPRPVVTDELEQYGPAASHYLRARPGITGLWQVSGRNDVSYDARVRMDVAYVDRWSLGGDFVIMLNTIPAALTAKGSY